MKNRTFTVIHYRLFVIFFISYFILLSHTAIAGGWSEVGAPTRLPPDGRITALCTDVSGNVYIAVDVLISADSAYVAKWDGQSWTVLTGSGGVTGITAICSDAAGNIYAARSTSNNTAGNNYISMWDGQSWSWLSGSNAPASSQTAALCSDAAGNIYAAGLLPDGNGHYYVAKWGGGAWTMLGGTTLAANNGIFSLCTDRSGYIYAAGLFSNASNNTYVARWDGTSWSELGGTNALAAVGGGNIYSVCSDATGHIYVGGDFSLPQSTTEYSVAKWDGTSWSALADQRTPYFNGMVHSVCSDAAGYVYAGGDFTNANGEHYVAIWNDSAWAELGGSNTLAANNKIAAICTHGNRLYTGGWFTNTDGHGYTAMYGTEIYAYLSDTICQGSSLQVGQESYTPGEYTDTIRGGAAGDTILFLSIGGWAQPHVSWPQTDTSWDIASPPPALTGGSPPGGYYTGFYVTADSIVGLHPDSNTTDFFTVTYHYTDSHGCTGSASRTFIARNSTGIQTLTDAATIHLYTNPNKGSFTLLSSMSIGQAYTISDMLGKIVIQDVIKSDNQSINIHAASGIYMLKLGNTEPIKLVIN
jgi:hypothetical protein